MRGQGKSIPMSTRHAVSPEQMAALADEVVKCIIAACPPDDAIMVSVAVVKIIGELAKHECGEEEAKQMLLKATEVARGIRVRIEPVAPETDPFVIEPTDPFSLPGDEEV